jgi:hypothetical protein
MPVPVRPKKHLLCKICAPRRIVRQPRAPHRQPALISPENLVENVIDRGSGWR